MKKVLVKAYCKNNLGDDLFLKILFERFPRTTFILLAPKYYESFCEQYENVVLCAVHEPNNFLLRLFWFVMRIIFPKKYEKYRLLYFKHKYNNLMISIDAFISIGGSIFMEPKYGASQDSVFYQYVTSYRKPMFLLGSNFGPFKKMSFLEFYKRLFMKCSSVTFRDLYSFNLFSDIEKVMYYPDVVFSLPLKSQNKVKCNNSLGITIRYRGEVDKKLFVLNHVKIIESFINEGGIVKLFSFCNKEGDAEILNEVYANLVDSNINIDKVERVFYNGDIDSFIYKYSMMSFMICERFHSLVISLILNQKILPIVYSDKMINVLEDLDYTEKFYTLSEFVLLENPILEISNIFKNYSYELPEEYRSKAIKHFEILDNILSNE